MITNSLTLTTSFGLSFLLLMSSFKASAQGIFEKIPNLSEEALSKLVAHYSTEAGLETEENVVLSWTPMDAKGSLLPEMKLQSTARGQGKPDWISYDSANQSILFDDSEVGADGRYLSGSLSHEATTSMTVFWLGHYAEEAPFASSGTYAYNIGPNHTSHQRDDSGDTYIVEQYNGTTYKGDSIQGFDGIPTVWSTVVNGSSHQFYANGINLNMQGDPTYSIPADTSLVVGAYSGSGYDFVGSMRELLIFDVALGDEDRMLVESYLANLIAPTQPEESLRLSHTDDGLLLEIPSQHILAQSSNLHDWTVVPYHYRSRTLEVSPTENRLFFKSQETFQTLPSGVVLITRVASDTFREVQLHLDTGELYFIGEKSHGFDLYTSSGNHLWWCYMNTTSKGSGLLEYVMEHQGQAATDKESAIEAGWHTYTADKYRFLKLEPLEGQKTFVNQEGPQQAGQTDTTRAYSEDYRTIDHETLFFTLYQNSQNGHIYLGAGGDSVERQAGIIPPGDGTPEKDNGLRADIAFRATIELTEEQKMELLHQFLPQAAIHGPEAVAYDYQHPPGL